MKIVVFNVKYSENLGDGLLALCLESGILMANPDIEVETIDLAGRTAFGMHSRNRKHLLKILRLFPPFLRRHLVGWKLNRQLAGYVEDWDKRISTADAVIIGGGNLLQDDDLNFPTKIATVLACIRRHDRPLAIYAVGVAGNWSRQARRLFGALESSNLVHCSVRDKLAQDAFVRHFPKLAVPQIVRDPALCASTMLQTEPHKKRDRKQLGICVTDPVILARHANANVEKIPVLANDEYRALIKNLVCRGYDVSLFCNGAREDMAQIDKLCAQPYMSDFLNNKRVRVCLRPEHPKNLLEIIRNLDAIIAHRLHACIAAYALGVPHIGLDWDSKVKGFFSATKRERFFADAGSNALNVAEMACSAIKIGIQHDLHTHNLERASSDIENLVGDIWHHLSNSPENLITNITTKHSGSSLVEPVLTR